MRKEGGEAPGWQRRRRPGMRGRGEAAAARCSSPTFAPPALRSCSAARPRDGQPRGRRWRRARPLHPPRGRDDPRGGGGLCPPHPPPPPSLTKPTHNFKTQKHGPRPPAAPRPPPCHRRGGAAARWRRVHAARASRAPPGPPSQGAPWFSCFRSRARPARPCRRGAVRRLCRAPLLARPPLRRRPCDRARPRGPGRAAPRPAVASCTAASPPARTRRSARRWRPLPARRTSRRW